MDTNERPRVATIVLVTGYNAEMMPGFAAAVVGTGESYEWFGKPATFEEKTAMLEKFSAWKHKVGPKIDSMELDRGMVSSFFNGTLGVPGAGGQTFFDIGSYYAGVMGKPLEHEAHMLLEHGDIAKRARKIAKLYELLRKIRQNLGQVQDSYFQVSEVLKE